MQEHYGFALPHLLGGQPHTVAFDREIGHARVSTRSAPGGVSGTWLTSNVMDVFENNFQTAVIERSRSVPVVVDFWAEWCGPCRQLGPALERAAAARSGKLELAKVDVDANQRLARDFRIQSIPAVKAFRDGQVAAEFIGAQPPQAIDKFMDSLLPSEADTLVQRGDEESLRQALALEPSRPDAAVALAKMLLARGELDEALEILSRVPGSFAAD